MDRLADFAAHFVMDPVRVSFVPHTFAAQLFLGLRGAEKIRRQFRAAQVVENVFLGFEPLAPVDAAHPQSAVKSVTPVIH